jgi:hypothetical protein
VNKPPPEKVAYKEYFRNLWESAPFSRNGSQNNSRFGSKRNSVAPSARASAKATPVVSPGRKSPKESRIDSPGLPDAPLATPVKIQKKKKVRYCLERRLGAETLLSDIYLTFIAVKPVLLE